MATNCYNLEIPVDVCVDGPVGGGATATLTVRFPQGNLSFGTLVLPTTFPPETDWDGSEVEFADWSSSGFWEGCTVLSTSLKVKLVDDNKVQLDLFVRVTDCGGGGPIGHHLACDGPGPHVFIDTRIIDINATPCPIVTA